MIDHKNDFDLWEKDMFPETVIYEQLTLDLEFDPDGM